MKQQLINNIFPLAEETSGIGEIINNLTTNIQGQLTLVLSGVAIVAMIANAIYGMIMGSDDGPRAKKRFMSIGFWYLVGVLAAQIVGWLSNMSGSGFE